MSNECLTLHKQIWRDKAVLRRIYTNYYKRIMAATVPGRCLEIGGGSGNFKEFNPSAVSSDIVLTPWTDVAADAQRLPFRSDVFGNVVMIDVLHHIECPECFLHEAARVLQPAGRLVMIEPAITALSGIFYRLLHPEPVDMSIDPLAHVPRSRNRAPFDANQAIPTLMFNKYREQFTRAFPEFFLLEVEYFDLLAYPLSGGFRRWSLIPSGAVGLFERIERALASSIGRLAAFRMMVVLEKEAATK